MRNTFIFLIFVICLAACSKTDAPFTKQETQNEILNQSNSLKIIDPIPTPTRTTPKVEVPVPKVVTFAIETFFRHSEMKDEKMNILPPFQHAEISFFVESVKVKTGDDVTAIPLQIDYENLTLKVKSHKKVPFLDCDRQKSGSEIELEKITEKQLLEAKAISNRGEDQPFDVFIFYPAVKNAKKLKQTELAKEMPPETVEVEQVVAAIDLNTDGKPDLLVSNYCCYDSSQCDCTNNFQKINSKWKYLGGSEPC